MTDDEIEKTLSCVIRCMRDDPEEGLPLSMHPIIDIEVGDTFRGPEGRLWEVTTEFVEADEVQLRLVNGEEKRGFSRAELSKEVVDGPWEKVVILNTQAGDDGDPVAEMMRDLLEASPEVTQTQMFDAIQLYRTRRDDPDLDVGVEFLVDHALEDAGVPREDRIAITDQIVERFG